MRNELGEQGRPERAREALRQPRTHQSRDPKPCLWVRRESAPETAQPGEGPCGTSQANVPATAIGVRSFSGERIQWGKNRGRAGRDTVPHPRGIQETHAVRRAIRLVAARTILLAAPAIATGKVKMGKVRLGSPP